MVKKLKEWFDNLPRQVRTFGIVMLAAFVLITIHGLTTSVKQGWASWGISVPALACVLITAVARIQDITANGPRWFARRIGLLLVASGALALIAAPIVGYTNSFPSWRACTLYWGFAITWITTPNMPPWHKYISGEYKLKRSQQA